MQYKNQLILTGELNDQQSALELIFQIVLEAIKLTGATMLSEIIELKFNVNLVKIKYLLLENLLIIGR